MAVLVAAWVGAAVHTRRLCRHIVVVQVEASSRLTGRVSIDHRMKAPTMLVLAALAFGACLAVQLKQPSRQQRELRSLLSAGGVVNKFREGLNMAGRLLGLDTAQGVAHLVSTSLLSAQPNWFRQEAHPHGLFSAFFRLLGLDSTKLGAIALNAVIFIAQLISNSLVERTGVTQARSKDASEGNPLSWILENPSKQVARLLRVAQDRTLPERLAQDLPGRHKACMELLLCKSAPFVWGMQRSLRALLQPDKETQARWRGLGPLQRMYEFLPGVNQVADHGDQCEERFQDCRLLPF